MKIITYFFLIILLNFTAKSQNNKGNETDISNFNNYLDANAKENIELDNRRVQVNWLKEENKIEKNKEVVNYKKKIMLDSINSAKINLNNISQNFEIKSKALELENIAEYKSTASIKSILINLTSNTEKMAKQKAELKRTVLNENNKSKIIILSKGGAIFDADSKIATFEKSDKNNDQVRIVHPQFDMYCNKLILILDKESTDSSIKEAICTGSVEILKTDKDGSIIIAIAERAYYDARTNKLHLKGWPQIQKGGNIQKAISKKTVMIIDQNGKLNTTGPTQVSIIKDKKKGGLKPKKRDPIIP